MSARPDIVLQPQIQTCACGAQNADGAAACWRCQRRLSLGMPDISILLPSVCDNTAVAVARSRVTGRRRTPRVVVTSSILPTASRAFARMSLPGWPFSLSSGVTS